VAEWERCDKGLFKESFAESLIKSIGMVGEKRRRHQVNEIMHLKSDGIKKRKEECGEGITIFRTK
jgi:hypothetical protein